jgi:hypothetical protein
MKKLFLILYDKMIAIEGVSYCRKWNNQLSLLLEGKIELFGLPAVFIAFKTGEIQQLGGGVQLYDPLTIEIHILDWQLDAGDGTFEQNLQVFDLKDKVFQALQKFEPGLTNSDCLCGTLVRVSEEEDNNHNGVFHFIQTYQTTYVDPLMNEPVNGIDSIEPIPFELDRLNDDGTLDNVLITNGQ